MIKKNLRWLAAGALAFNLAIAVPGDVLAGGKDAGDFSTKTPVKHVVVIFQENVSFDHYFATYAHAKSNNDGTQYSSGAQGDTPRANNLATSGLLAHNPNSANPSRIDRSVPNACDQDHNYGNEQKAFGGGLMDKFVESLSCNDPNLGKASAMGYYDDNTVTAIWNYAQHFALSDNHYGTTFGPSTPGAINLSSRQTFGATITNGLSGAGNIAGGGNSGAVIGTPILEGTPVPTPSERRS